MTETRDEGLHGKQDGFEHSAERATATRRALLGSGWAAAALVLFNSPSKAMMPAPHTDVNHNDTAHTDSHQDAHSDSHTDHHTDFPSHLDHNDGALHYDYGASHTDSGHTNSHWDEPHGDHQDAAHVDGPTHSDNHHHDGSFSDSHTDWHGDKHYDDVGPGGHVDETGHNDA